MKNKPLWTRIIVCTFATLLILFGVFTTPFPEEIRFQVAIAISYAILMACTQLMIWVQDWEK